MYRPSALRHFLESIGTKPTKSLSQNFLIDGNIIRNIVAGAEIQPEDIVLEIGPGPGALTEALLAAGASVIAVEKDPLLGHTLERFQNSKLSIYIEDILDFPVAQEIESAIEGNSRKAKVVANLPYHLTTPILTKLIPENTLFSSILVMVQYEVAKRFTAPPGSKEYGSISVFLKFYSDPQLLFSVSRNCFYPSPKVDSAVVRFLLHPAPPLIEPDLFFPLVRTAFGQRRKMLRSTLSPVYGQKEVLEALHQGNISLQARPEELSLEQFITLYRLLKMR